MLLFLKLGKIFSYYTHLKILMDRSWLEIMPEPVSIPSTFLFKQPDLLLTGRGGKQNFLTTFKMPAIVVKMDHIFLKFTNRNFGNCQLHQASHSTFYFVGQCWPFHLILLLWEMEGKGGFLKCSRFHPIVVIQNEIVEFVKWLHCTSSSLSGNLMKDCYFND